MISTAPSAGMMALGVAVIDPTTALMAYSGACLLLCWAGSGVALVAALRGNREAKRPKTETIPAWAWTYRNARARWQAEGSVRENRRPPGDNPGGSIWSNWVEVMVKTGESMARHAEADQTQTVGSNSVGIQSLGSITGCTIEEASCRLAKLRTTGTGPS